MSGVPADGIKIPCKLLLQSMPAGPSLLKHATYGLPVLVCWAHALAFSFTTKRTPHQAVQYVATVSNHPGIVKLSKVSAFWLHQLD